jgi:hypothetical protein
MNPPSPADFEAARAKLGLDRAQLQELRAFLSGQTFGRAIPCDHTHARTEEWAGRMGLDMEAVVEGLKAFGGGCDCAVVQRVTPDRFGW